MKCPHCGSNLPTGKNKCLRCGYECKEIVLSADDSDKRDHKKEEASAETRDVDMRTVHVSRAGGSIFDDLFGESIFGGLFGDLLGGFFGTPYEDEADGYDDDPKNYDAFGARIQRPDEFSRDCVEIAEVEYLEETDKKRKRKLFGKDDGKNDGDKKS